MFIFWTVLIPGEDTPAQICFYPTEIDWIWVQTESKTEATISRSNTDFHVAKKVVYVKFIITIQFKRNHCSWYEGFFGLFTCGDCFNWFLISWTKKHSDSFMMHVVGRELPLVNLWGLLWSYLVSIFLS